MKFIEEGLKDAPVIMLIHGTSLLVPTGTLR